MRNNIVTVEYTGGCYIRAAELMQYDYGQILHLSGFGLPGAFQVDFGTSQIAGETVQVIGALDHVAIPDTLLQGAANIYAFIRLHTGADDGETVFVVELPVMARPEITGEEPTPVEQDLIDQLMAALTAGVAAAEAAAAQIERMSAEASTLPAGSPATAAWDAEHGKLLLGIPKGDTGADGAEGPEGPEGPAGSDGYSPTVTVEAITGGHRVTITDAEGDHVFDVMDGEGGGGSAVSPTVTVTDIAGGHRVTITDIDHPLGQSFDVMDGENGADGINGTDGVSPEVTIASITGGHSVTITDADHPNGQTFNIMDGQDGQNGQNGAPGADGTTFTPAVSSAGVLSWTNDGGKQNPPSVDLVAAVLAALPTWTGGSY